MSNVAALKAAPGDLTRGVVCFSLLWFDFAFNRCYDMCNSLKYLQACDVVLCQLVRLSLSAWSDTM